MENLPRQQRAYLPSSQERAAHREWIGGRALTLLSHYWRDDDPVELTAAIGKDWADVLEGIPAEYVQRACIQYQRDEPRRKPTPGAIYQLARAAMPKPEIVRPRDLSAPLRDEGRAPTEEERAEAEMAAARRREAANEILARAGYAAKVNGGADEG